MRWLAVLILFVTSACATPKLQSRLDLESTVQPSFTPEQNEFTSFDGAKLGLSVWEADQPTPEYVVVGLHGMNDYANAFHMLAPWMAKRGVTTYAYDQRGFGRSDNRGIWPKPDLMRKDLRTAIELARQRHPNTPVAVVGISMGGAVAMTVFGSGNPPVGVDRLILSGPGLRGWGTLNPLYKASLWLSTHVRPGWVVRPPRGVKIEPSDNVEMLQDLWRDPLGLKENRIDQVFGLVGLMEEAHGAAPALTPNVPTLITYGAKDIVIPPSAIKRTIRVLPDHVRTAYYEGGYHMLLRDLQAETVFADLMAFLKDDASEFPSGAPNIPRD
ncbi:lysophospholipase [Henriciella mobilis]|uniref:alpha/beta hydrolase n=1 Tax=Henriciella mobilis TaxID=2305467 RepID=UPI000E66A15C|nr:alpha/beta hydrolase [Henriciella mobilis]RIJ15328.1 lysophospholipase [Henriciella mobilis]RIJ18792.1 lysophospholipase [Henriciella mobilis]